MAKDTSFPFPVQLISRQKKRPPPWNKGLKKENNRSVKKISETFKKKKLDNFLKWREGMKKTGKIRSVYPNFTKSKKLAFLIGVSLGDGNIQRCPRTDRLLISLNTKYPKLIDFVANVVSEIFEKKAVVEKVKKSNCVRVGVYQKFISKRLCIPAGDRRKTAIEIPDWIWNSKDYLIWYLKGLFEAEGSLSIHLPTCTYNFAFSNRNEKLLENVKKSLIKLGFRPEVRNNAIRLRKKAEVECFRKLICFREF